MLDRARTLANQQLPLCVKGVGFRAGGKPLINHLDLEIASSGVTAIMGPNGAGKSVLVRLLHGLLVPDAGSITWNGQLNGVVTRKHQAMVFQKPVLLRRSLAANIDFVLKLKQGANTSRRDALLAQANLADKAGQPARSLSGGEQQRLALVRALAANPQVLFLDEPTASLDPASTEAIETIISDTAARGVKIVLVTHDAGQARRLADDVVFVHHGKVLEHTNKQKFFNNPSTSAARDYLAGRIVN